jgi:nitrogen-specific signal transduction histidine kinase/CheY-like chemotaxis protein
MNLSKNSKLIVLVGLFVVFLLLYQKYIFLNEDAKASFTNESSDLVALIESRLDVYNSQLSSIESYFSASSHVNKDEFSEFTSNVLKTKGILAVCYKSDNENYSSSTTSAQYCDKYRSLLKTEFFVNQKVLTMGKYVHSTNGQMGFSYLVIDIKNLEKIGYLKYNSIIEISQKYKNDNRDKLFYHLVVTESTLFKSLNKDVSIFIKGEKSKYRINLNWKDYTVFFLLLILFSVSAYTFEIRSISDLKLKQSQKIVELNDIFSATPSCLKIINREGLLVEMNQQGLDLIGADDFDSVNNANVYDLVDEDCRQEFISFNESVCAGNKETLVFNITSLDGVKRCMESYAAPYTLSNGEIGHIAITNDITKKISDEIELKKQKVITQHHTKLASIGELAAGVGHEINNPLAIIKGYLAVVNKKIKKNPDIVYSDLSDYFSKINISIDRIAKIVKGLRNFSRSDQIDSLKFNPIEAIEESYYMIDEIYHNDGIEIKLAKNILNENICLDANRGNFQQILLNLITNARDAVSDNKDKIINIEIEADESSLTLKVKDNGSGIPAEILDKIYDPFFTTKDVNKGTGIGLSLVHSFIKEMNGELHCTSIPGSGTSFIIKWPIVIETIEPIKKEELTVSSVKYKMRAIIADDEEDIRVLLSNILENMGFEVTAVENGQLAYDIFIKNPSDYDVIVTDMKMPIMDGAKLVKSIRAHQEIVQPKVILMTGGTNIEFESADSELKDLQDGYFFKPFDEKEITDVLFSCLGSKFNKIA